MKNFGLLPVAVNATWQRMRLMILLFICGMALSRTTMAQSIIIDGNPIDWTGKFTDPNFNPKTFVVDRTDATDTGMTGGGSKDDGPISGWTWSGPGTVTPAKDNIENAGVLKRGDSLFFFFDRLETSGDANYGFWLFKNPVSIDSAGHFTGVHTDGDLFVAMQFLNGGGVGNPVVYKWTGTAEAGTIVSVNLSAAAAKIATNLTGYTPPWPYHGDSSGHPELYKTNAFLEGFINLDSLGETDLCFTTFMFDSRTSQSTSSVIKDIVFGAFRTRPEVTVNDTTVCKGENAYFTATVTGGIPPFQFSWNGGAFAPANTYSISAAQTNTVVFVQAQGSNGCISIADTGHLTVKPTPTVTATPDINRCNGASAGPITFSSSPSGASFSWTGTSNVGFGTSGNSSSIGSFTATNNGTTTIIDTVIVTPTLNGCSGKADTFLVTVYPTPTVGEHLDMPYCNGATGSAITFTGTPDPGVTFSWVSNADVGFGTANTGNIGTFTATNTGSVTVTARVIVTPSANGCTGRPDTFNVIVYPTPTVGTHGDVPYCNGAAGAAITFTGTPNPGVTFTWTGTKDVGFGTGSTGNIGTFTATNSGTVTVTDTVIVTPSANGCTGRPDTFLITVYPTPTVGTHGDVTYCNNASAAAINFSGTPANVTFSWVSNADVGFGTANTGNIGTFTANNPGSTPIIARVIVTPSANGCTGIPDTFLITVNPTPNVFAHRDTTYCPNVLADSIHFDGNVVGTEFDWTSSINVGFNLAGTGTILQYITIGGAATRIATVIVTPVAQTCIGRADTFLVTINPNAGANAPEDPVQVCNGAFQDSIHIASLDPTVITHWRLSSNALGFGTSGTGNLPSFTGDNGGAVPIVVTVTITASTTAGCPGVDSVAFPITINPNASSNAPVSNFAICSGANFPDSIDIRGLDLVDTFKWTSTLNVGFGTSGTGNIHTFNAILNPGPGVITATVTITSTSPAGCAGPSGGFVVSVNPLPAVDARDTSVCAGTAAFSLASLGTPSGGTWSGTGVTPPSTFDPTGLANGPHKVYYTFTDANTCTSNDSSNVTINALPTVVAKDTAVCAGTAAFSLVSLGTPVGGTWSGTGVTPPSTFTPAGLSLGAHKVIYTVSDANKCSNFDSAFITINGLPTVVARDTTICAGVGSFSLASLGSPSGGTWSGTGVTPPSTFNPAGLSLGAHKVFYTVSDENKCSNFDSAFVTINSCGNVFATFTQGFWGSPGKHCDGQGTNRNATSLINFLLNNGSGPIVIGLPGRSVRIPIDAAVTVNNVMPGGKTPNKLTVAANVDINTPAFAPYLTGGRINNVFLSQMIALKLGTRIIPGLLGFPIVYNPAGDSKFQTCGTSTTDCANFTTSGGCSCWTLKQSVTNYVTKGGTKTATLADLIAVADSLIGGGITPGAIVGGYKVPSYADMSDAIDLFNNAFDNFRSFPGAYGCPGAKTPVAGGDDGDLESAMKVYPNPTTGTFTIEIPAIDKDAHIAIVDVNGRAVMSVTFKANTFGQTQQVDMPNVAPGLYIIHVENAGRIFSKKLMVQ